MTKIKPFCLTPRYYETDKMGIIHHSNYIRWLEEARIDFLAQMGFPYDEMEKKDILIPVLSVECEYKNSVRYGEKVIIRLKVTEFSGVRFKIEYRVTNSESGALNAVGYSTHCFLNSELRPIRINKVASDIYEMFKDCCGCELY